MCASTRYLCASKPLQWDTALCVVHTTTGGSSMSTYNTPCLFYIHYVMTDFNMTWIRGQLFPGIPIITIIYYMGIRLAHLLINRVLSSVTCLFSFTDIIVENLIWQLFCTRREFLREILYKNIAIIAIQDSKMYLVDTFGDFSHTVE